LGYFDIGTFWRFEGQEKFGDFGDLMLKNQDKDLKGFFGEFERFIPF